MPQPKNAMQLVHCTGRFSEVCIAKKCYGHGRCHQPDSTSGSWPRRRPVFELMERRRWQLRRRQRLLSRMLLLLLLSSTLSSCCYRACWLQGFICYDEWCAFLLWLNSHDPTIAVVIFPLGPIIILSPISPVVNGYDDYPRGWGCSVYSKSRFMIAKLNYS